MIRPLSSATGGLLVALLLVACGSQNSGSASEFGYKPSNAMPKDIAECGLAQARCGSGPMFVVQTLNIVPRKDDGTVDGFNLDGIVSDGEGADDCRYEDFTSPDGREGIDNQLTNLLDSFPDEIREALPLLLQNAIGTGGLLLIAELVGVSDLKNDDQVGIIFRRSDDLPIIGTDNLVVAGQTFSLANNHFAGAYADGRIEDGRFLAGPFELDLQIQVFGVNYFITFRDVQIDFTLTESGEVSEGLLGGSVHLDDIEGVADTIVVSDLGQLVKAIVPPFADVKSADTEQCDQISGGLNISGVSAFLFDDVPEVRDDDMPLTGPDVFAKAGCIGCHAVSDVPGAEQTVGPSLDGLGDRAGTTHDGRDAEAYVRQAILNPEIFIVDGYERMVMPDDTRTRMTEAEFETLVGWLLTL